MSGLVEIPSNPNLSPTRNALLNNGVKSVSPTRPYFVSVSNFQKTAVHMHKNLRVGPIESDFDPCADISEVGQANCDRLGRRVH